MHAQCMRAEPQTNTGDSRMAMLALSTLATVTGAPQVAHHRTEKRLLVVYVAGRDTVSTARVSGVKRAWSSMQV